ncbi:RUS family member 1-like isoform X2 [Branchiostoma floridae]|uniref:RUS family member 1-like isoform X2 n=1 Tax=Branchiostoma floridae TaxID=7739 RepID=A0A9J7K818_BRAFL|nr:RUS family member 1-like isoform X2 [Branchiostoma floridae]
MAYEVPVKVALSDMGEKTVCEEHYGSESLQQRYTRLDDGTIVKRSIGGQRFSSLVQFFRSVFLPQGYPESVSDDYLSYQIWDTVQAFCSSITGTLATQAVLKGVGVGDETATAAGATITWILKDGTGMLGRILFAWLQGTSLDCDAKRWRLFADIVNDFSIFLELVAPAFPLFFTGIVCVAGVGKAIVGVSGGATRAALTMHQARRDNMADVSAKDGSQETLVNLMALLAGLVVTPMVADNPLLTWFLFFVFTCLHLFANYNAVTCVVMETLNQSRLHILVSHYLRTGVVLNPAQANVQEPVVFAQKKSTRIKLGSPMSSIIQRATDLDSAIHSNSEGRYLLGMPTLTDINIVLHQESSHLDFIKSCFQAEIIDYVIEHRFSKLQVHSSVPCYDNQAHSLIPSDKAFQSMVEQANHKALWELVDSSHEVAAQVFPSFHAGLAHAGWTTHRTQLGPDEWRASWDIHGLSDKKSY